MNRTFGELSRETLTLRDYTKDLTKGALVRYEDVARRTGIDMDKGLNRTRLRKAIEYNGHVCDTVMGVGYRIPATTTDAIVTLAKIERRGYKNNRQGLKTIKRIKDQYELDDTTEQQLGIIQNAWETRFGVRIGSKVFGRTPPKTVN